MFNIYNLHYYKLVKYYVSIYGKTNVMVLPNEAQNVTDNKYKSVPVCLMAFSKTKYGKK